MEEIVKTTHYWLLKPLNKTSLAFFVRVKTDGIDKVMWSVGHKNRGGSVSLTGGILDDVLCSNLEDEFQLKINGIR